MAYTKTRRVQGQKATPTKARAGYQGVSAGTQQRLASTPKKKTTPAVTNPMVEQQPQQEVIAQPVAQPAYDPTSNITALSEARKQAQIEGLRQRKQQALQGIEQERADIPQQYREQRRQASVQSKMGAKSFGEFLASRGLARSGQAAQAQLMQGQALQGQLGAIGRQEQGALDRLSREQRGIEQGYLSDVGMAEAGIAADTMQQMIAARQRQQDIARADMIRQEDIARQMGIRAEDIGREQERYDYTRGLQEQQQALAQQQRLEDIAREQQRFDVQQGFKEQEAERDYDLALGRLGIDSRGMDLREKQMVFENALQERRLAEDIRSSMASEGLRGAELSLSREKYEKPTSDKAPTKLSEIEYGEAFNEAFEEIKPLSWEQAQQRLTRDAGQIIGVLGQDGYEQLWNAVFADAIRKGRTDLMYGSMFRPEEE